MDISGMVAIVTGASEGIGRATAQRLAQAGAKLVLAARNEARLLELAEEIRRQNGEAHAIPTDLRDPLAVKNMVDRAFEHFDRIDALFNNAGQSAAGMIATVDPEVLRQVLDLNLFGALYAIQAVVPRMKESGGGVIVNVSSMVSKLKIPGLGTYAASKAALNVLSATARVELAADNIRVITVFPRTTATDLGKHSAGDLRMREQQRARAVSSGQPVDSPEFVAGKILEAVRDEVEEKYMEG